MIKCVCIDRIPVLYSFFLWYEYKRTRVCIETKIMCYLNFNRQKLLTLGGKTVGSPTFVENLFNFNLTCVKTVDSYHEHFV